MTDDHYASSPGNRPCCCAEPAVSSQLVAKNHRQCPQRDGQAELAWMAGYILRWYAHPKMVIHPSSNGAEHRLTSLTLPILLPLCQTATRVLNSQPTVKALCVIQVCIRHATWLKYIRLEYFSSFFFSCLGGNSP